MEGCNFCKSHYVNAAPGFFPLILPKQRELHFQLPSNNHRVKNREGKTEIFLFLGRTVRADIFGQLKVLTNDRICARKSSLSLNNLLSNKYPISMFDLTK